ncbi:hypothetical protein [Anabaena sp. UHCC 0187]|jgi:hypothetical protein|nr:hypothetical protein [Anabaena sp. UHCC 0187]
MILMMPVCSPSDWVIFFRQLMIRGVAIAYNVSAGLLQLLIRKLRT